MSEEQAHRDSEILTADVTTSSIPAFNHFEDAAFSLRLVAELLPRVRDEEQHWKWVIVALHSALQGFMVLALDLGNGFAIIQDGPLVRKINCPHCGRKITEMIKRNWGTLREWRACLIHYEGTTHPKPQRLLSFSELYRRIKSPRYMERLYGSKAFKATSRQNKSVKRLNSEFRNEFIHFLPQYWLDDAAELLRIVDDCLQVISFLVSECGNILWDEKTNLESQVHSSIESIRQAISSLETAFASAHK